MGESGVDGGEKVDSIVDTRRSGFWKSVATKEETRKSVDVRKPIISSIAHIFMPPLISVTD